MSEVGIKPDVAAPAEPLSAPKKLAVLIAVAGVMGFAVGWLLSMVSDEWGSGQLSALGLCLGALIGGIIGRLGMKEAR
jgi:hypothetical protein